MSFAKFASVVKSARVRENDRTWFVRWVDTYRESCGVSKHDRIPVDRESLIAFLRAQKSQGRKTWQRLQIVKAVECYRNIVLRTSDPDLGDIRETPAIAAAQERSAEPATYARIDLVGIIAPNEPEPIRAVRRELRLLHRSLNTEKAYVKRVKEFLKRFRIETLQDLQAVGESQVTQFLTEMAVDRNVAASTQNQAFNALLWLFEHVLKRDLQFINAVRSRKPKNLSKVYSVGEVSRVMSYLGGWHWLAALVPSGEMALIAMARNPPLAPRRHGRSTTLP